MLRRHFPSASAAATKLFPRAAAVATSGVCFSAARGILPGTDAGVIKSPSPSVKHLYDQEESLWHRYDADAKKHADKTAFVCGASGRSRTFKESHARTLEYAKLMQHGMNLRAGDTVVLLSPNCLDWVNVCYGAIAIGARVSPVNPLCTPQELKKILTSAPNVKAVFVYEPFKATVATALGLMQSERESSADAASPPGPESAMQNQKMPQVFTFTDNTELPESYPDLKFPKQRSKDDVAVLPHSSGTTGPFKLVQLSHGNILANLHQTNSGLGLTDKDVFVSSLPLFHIFGMVVVQFLGHMVGAKQVVMPKFDVDQYMDLVDQHKATQLFVVPPMFLALLKSPVPAESKKAKFGSVKRIVSGAAPLGEQLQHQAEAIFDPAQTIISQGYGQSEQSPVTSMSSPASVSPEKFESPYGHVGPLVADTEARVINVGTGKDVTEFGEEGELLVRGPQTMRGYVNEEDNKGVFGGDCNTWFRTGDIVKVNPDFTLTVTDRIKELIKVKGFQVAPAEIEAVLQHHDKVAEAIVIGVPTTDGSGDELPYAQVALKPAVAAELHSDAARRAVADELIEYVAKNLSHYKKLRGGCDIVATVPKSLTGKLLRRVVKQQKLDEMKKQKEEESA